MEYVGVFLFGVAVTALVVAACVLIVFGIITERRDREKLEADNPEGIFLSVDLPHESICDLGSFHD